MRTASPEDVFAAAREAVAELPARVLLTVGRDADFADASAPACKRVNVSLSRLREAPIAVAVRYTRGVNPTKEER